MDEVVSTASERRKCAAPGCSTPFEIVVDPARGHRTRKYCCESCKSAAYRLRQLEAQRRAEEEAERQRQEQQRQKFRECYGEDLLPETIETLRLISARYPASLLDVIAATMRAEINRVVGGQEQQERARLAQAMMDLGEPDYHSLMIDHQGDLFVVLGGRRAWQSFADKASVEHLRTIYDCYLAPIERAQRRRAGVQS